MRNESQRHEAEGVRTPPVRGRDVELAALGQQLDRIRSGTGAVVLVEGAAGIGKSRVLAEAAEMARRRSVRVGASEAAPGDSVVELATLLEALFGGSAPLLDRVALREPHAVPEQRYWLLQDVEALLERATQDGPLLVSVDDVQWADGGTAAALRLLPSRLAALPIGWLLAYRPGQGSHSVQAAIEVLERGGAEKLVLGPLDRRGVARVAADAFGAEPDGALLRMAEQTHGSPFLLVELLAGLRDEELVSVRSGRAELIEPRLPDRVRGSMRKRLARMSPPARKAVTVATALGRKFTFADLATMNGTTPAALLEPVDELVRADLLVEGGDTLAFRHDLIRDAVRESLPGSVRRALDRHAADVMLGRGALPVEVATQLADSAELGDEVAVTTLLKAAEELATTDPGIAANFSQRALELAPPKHPLRGLLTARTAVLLHAAGRGKRAKEFADTALRQALPPAQQAQVRLSIAEMFAISPDVRADSCRQGLALPGLPPAPRARLLAHLFHNLVVAGRPDEARRIQNDVAAAVRGDGDRAAQFTLELASSALEYMDGRFERAHQLVQASLRTGLDAGEDSRERLAQHFRCGILAATGRMDEAFALAGVAVATAQRERQRWALHMFETWRGRQYFQTGRLADAAAALDSRYSDGGADMVVTSLDAASVLTLGRIALHTGDSQLGRRTQQVGLAMLAKGMPVVRRHAAWLLALQAMAEGDPHLARDRLCALGETAGTSILPLFPLDPTDETHLVRIGRATGDQVLIEHAVATAEQRAAANPAVLDMAATAAHTRGLAGDSPEELAEAVRLFEPGFRRLALASALEDLGRVCIGRGAADRGVDALDRALPLYAKAGAGRDAARVRRWLREQGVRRRLASAERPEHGWAAMTESELAVVRLIADGMTNREAAEHLFLSPHTVNSHLRHVYAKLEINSRAALARLVVANDQAPGGSAE